MEERISASGGRHVERRQGAGPQAAQADWTAEAEQLETRLRQLRQLAQWHGAKPVSLAASAAQEQHLSSPASAATWMELLAYGAQLTPNRVQRAPDGRRHRLSDHSRVILGDDLMPEHGVHEDETPDRGMPEREQRNASHESASHENTSGSSPRNDRSGQERSAYANRFF